jgi:hypothetical protein
MSVHIRRWMSPALVCAALLLPSVASAQSRSFEACSQGSMANCAGIRLTEQLGVGPGSSNLFEIALQNRGSATPGLASSIYFLALFTGHAADAEIDPFATPTAEGGASVSDPTPWSIAESGDAIFLSSLGNFGIGGCAQSAPVGGFGQMAQTCGDDQFITFSFFTSRMFDLDLFELADLEFVAIADGNIADSCNADAPCVITPVTATPEPGTLLLGATGFVMVGGFVRRRRHTAASFTTTSAKA